MKSVAAFVRDLFVIVVFVTASSSASAVTWELNGKLGVEYTLQTPQALLDLQNAPFTVYLTYDETALPTSVLSENFVNYSNQGSFLINTAMGSASGPFDNLQTFIMDTPDGRASNFNGASFSVGPSGPLSLLGLVPVSFDFSFHEGPWTNRPGLTSFALPSELNLHDFDDFNFIRVSFLSAAGQPQDTKLLGVIDSVSAIPEPQTYIMLLAGLALLGWRANRYTQGEPDVRPHFTI